LENQVSQLATTVGRLKAQGSRKLPSQTIVNPRENVSAITLRSGKEVEIPCKAPSMAKIEEEKEKEIELPSKEPQTSHKVSCQTQLHKSISNPLLPFPSRFAKSKKEEQEKEIIEMFRKVEVNIPLLDAIKQVPRYAKFLKELCTSKRKLRGNEKISVGENVSAVIQRKLPSKCKDPGMFTIPCMIGSTRFEKAMIDLGASINVMPYSVFASLKLGPLKKIGVVIQLADRSNVYPKGVVEDVLVKVNDLVFPADFYVLDMNDDQNAPVLLGRPFLKTTKTKIDVDSGTLTMEFDIEIVKFDIYDSMKDTDDNLLYSINAIDSLAQKVVPAGQLTFQIDKDKVVFARKH
jgi:hypothetical protein